MQDALVSVVSGVQRFKVPATGLYLVHAYGAAGADSDIPLATTTNYQ